MSDVTNSWNIVKKAIETVKTSTKLFNTFTEREKKEIDEISNLAMEVPSYVLSNGNLEASACMCSIAKSFIKLIEPYEADPEIKAIMKTCTDKLEIFAKGYDMVKLGLAMKAFEVNPAGACVAAWGGPGVAKNGIDFIRWVAPGLDAPEETKKIENRVFQMVGGGAGVGASAGALIGGAIGAFFGGVGAAPGAAIGAALGGCAGSVTGGVILAL